MRPTPTAQDLLQLRQVWSRLLSCIERGETIRLPDYNPDLQTPRVDYALLNVGLEPNHFGGHLGELRYQFEGEDDLLHLMVCRRDGAELSPEDGQGAAEIILPGVPAGMMWVKPGTRSQHFYLGHEVLAGFLQADSA